MKGRRTGKTFRAVLHALFAASEGKDVVFESHHPAHAFSFAANIADGSLSPDVLNIDFNRREIKISKGRIRFRAWDHVQPPGSSRHTVFVFD